MAAGRERSILEKVVSVSLIVAMTMLGCNAPPEGRPTAGIRDYQRPAHVPFRFGHVNAMGGNLVIPRVDLSIDTSIGTVEIGAVYNSTTKIWTWSFDEYYKNGTFIDASGSVHEGLDQLTQGSALPGTTWVKSSPLRIKSKAGLVSHFQGGSGKLRWMYWGDAPGTVIYPRLEFLQELVAGQIGLTPFPWTPFRA